MKVEYFFLGCAIGGAIFYYQLKQIAKSKYDPNLAALEAIAFSLTHIGILLTGVVVAYIFGT